MANFLYVNLNDDDLEHSLRPETSSANSWELI